MTAEHWDARYASTPGTDLSWFEVVPTVSLELVDSIASSASSVVDIGGGDSHLVDALLDRGHRDVTVVDISQAALTRSHDRIGDAPVTWVCSDIREWVPDRTFDVWHDRAAYHFLTDESDQQLYWELVRQSVDHGGSVVIGTFAANGPETCSGLPVARYSAESLERAMGDGFAVVTARQELHATPSGGQQAFTWLVAQRV